MPQLPERLEEREGGYAIVMTMIVMLVLSALALTFIRTTESGLRGSKRAGDSANALQVADAGVNAGIQKLTNFTVTSPYTESATLGSGDSYTYTITKVTPALWRVVSVGTGANGITRRVEADAKAQLLFSNAVSVKAAINFGSGVAVDSFVNGLTQANTCTLKGFVGSNDPAANDINVSGGGGGVRNCTEAIDAATGNVFDGCVGYADTEPVPAFQNESQNAVKLTCGTILRRTPKLIDQSTEPPGWAPVTSLGAVNCTTALNLTAGYYKATSLRLGNGCVIPHNDTTQEENGAVHLYVDGVVEIGTSASQEVNKPPIGECPDVDPNPSNSDYYSGTAKSPLWNYCSGWAGRTRIYGKAGSASTVNLANHVRFWGVVIAPSRAVTGGPQPIIWGAIAANSISSGAQISVHYDEALASLTSGRFYLDNWREQAG